MWISISKLEEFVRASEMFVAKAFYMEEPNMHGHYYTSEPFCVWLREGYSLTVENFARWPLPFPPTHFCLLPEDGSKDKC